MAGYVIMEVEVTDPVAYEEYRKVVWATIEQYGGKFIVRGGPIEYLEGGWQPSRVVIVEFESVEQAKRWYESEEYKAPKQMRQNSSNGRGIILQGI